MLSRSALCVCTQEEAINLVRALDASPKGYPRLAVTAALLQLFLGDTNRTICATPMNEDSSRSHCIFTVYVEARKVGC